VKKLSIVVPFYNEESGIKKLFSAVDEAIEKCKLDEYEIICIDDGSTDKTLSELKKISKNNDNYKIISLSRNFGHQAAISTGLEMAEGEYIFIIDADLQDPPIVLKELIDKIREGYEIVYCVRNKREGSLIKRFFYKSFYLLLKNVSNINIPLDSGDFCLITRRALNNIKSLRERSRFFRGIRAWVGFKQAEFRYDREDRKIGKSKYSYWKLINLAFDGITGFSNVPLRISMFTGFLFAFLSFIFVIFLTVLKISNPETFIEGTTLTRILILFVGGIQLIFLGIIGEYLSKIFIEVKKRPISLVNEIIGFNESQISKLKNNDLIRYE
jgi:polyisoprenyl-phosphate glycosyltransferase